MTTKMIPTMALLSLTSGKMLCPFGDMAEAAEWVAGHPIWSHEFGSRQLADSLRDKVLAVHPMLNIDVSHINPENVAAEVALLESRFPPTLAMPQGSDERTESPMESAARVVGADKVIGVVLD